MFDVPGNSRRSFRTGMVFLGHGSEADGELGVALLLLVLTGSKGVLYSRLHGSSPSLLRDLLKLFLVQLGAGGCYTSLVYHAVICPQDSAYSLQKCLCRS